MPLMITTCTGCQTRYRLDAKRVPPRLVRVRCPQCQAVFQLDGARPDVAADTPPAAPAPDLEPMTAAQPANDTPPTAGQNGAATLGAAPAAAAAPSPAAEPSAAVAVEDAPSSPTRRRSRDKARMLARALVSDILVYNRDLRDKALEEGNLLEALGGEIKKSWELYKEKVGDEAANGTTHFRDALNEILADGERIF
jgi:predicted Zn finger-like uncharacterized protein